MYLLRHCLSFMSTNHKNNCVHKLQIHKASHLWKVCKSKKNYCSLQVCGFAVCGTYYISYTTALKYIYVPIMLTHNDLKALHLCELLSSRGTNINMYEG
jgi:hypothetical protein